MKENDVWRLGAVGALASAVLACGSESDEPSAVTDNVTDGAIGGSSGTAGVPGTGGAVSTGGAIGAGGAVGAPDAAAPNESWIPLIQGEWTLAPSVEGYYCVVATVPETLYVAAFRPIDHPGSHHGLLTRGADREDGVFPCSAGSNGPAMIYATGVRTGTLAFPDGVAVRLDAGEKLLLNLHLFNTTTDSMTGVSGVEVLAADPATVREEAELVLAGKMIGLTVPPGESTEVGRCTSTANQTIFAISAHMHTLGVHLRSTAHSVASGPTVLLDTDYSFDNQQFYDVNPSATLAAGDYVEVECTYQNPGANTVSFGDSTLEEMCFSGLYRYPRTDAFLFCVN